MYGKMYKKLLCMLLTLGLFFTSYPVYASEYVKDANGTEIVNEEQNEKESNDSESNEYVNDNSEESTELYQNTEVSEYHDADVNEVNKKVDIDEKKRMRLVQNLMRITLIIKRVRVKMTKRKMSI